MPIYLYEVIQPDGTGGEQFEWLQPMSAEPFTTHPETGEPVRRLIGTPNTPRKWTDSHAKGNLSDNRLESLGFTKYVKGDGGKYEKRFGKGPDSVKKPPSGS